MRKILKIVGITIASLILIMVLGVSILLWVIFTPERLTPIVTTQLNKNLLCQTSMKGVELTFFSTFPNFTLKLDELVLHSTLKEAPSDTLLYCSQAQATLDIQRLVEKKELHLYELELNNPSISLFTNKEGKNNFTIVAPDTTTSTEPFQMPLSEITLRKIAIRQATIDYQDQTLPLAFRAEAFNMTLEGEMINSSLTTDITMEAQRVNASMGSENYLDQQPLQLATSFTYPLNGDTLALHSLTAQYGETKLTTNGNIDLQRMVLDLAYQMEIPSLVDLINRLPESYQKMAAGYDIQGEASSTGTIWFPANHPDSLRAKGDLSLRNMNLLAADFKEYPISNLSLAGDFSVDMAQPKEASFYLKKGTFETLKSRFEVVGTAKELLGDILLSGNIKGDLQMASLSPIILKPMGYQASGTANFTLQTQARLSALTSVDLNKVQLSGAMTLRDFEAVSRPDTLRLQTPQTALRLRLHPPTKDRNSSFLNVEIESPKIAVEQGKGNSVDLDKVALKLFTSDVRDTTKVPSVNCDFSIGNLKALANGASASINNLKGNGGMRASSKRQIPVFSMKATSEQLQAALDGDRIRLQSLTTDLKIAQNSQEKEIALQWIPSGHLALSEALIETGMINQKVRIPVIDLKLSPNQYTINESSFIIGQSDFELKGTLSNIREYFKKEGVLKGNFSFDSENTDLPQLMSLAETPKPGNEASQATQQPTLADSGTANAVPMGPIMVPEDLDLKIKANVKKAQWYNSSALKDIRGDVVVKNGQLIFDNLNLYSPGGKMKLTALYRTPQRNRLFVQFNFHLLDVEIRKLLHMIPDIDTIMPMLRSFAGKGEFHAVGESYMDSLYNLKRSTLHGTASLKGKELILMDGETFSEIAKRLLFSKKTVNIIDSISAEFALFKNNIDVYPFVISMDKYQAMISGRHNLDMSFDYGISVVKSPLPFHLGLKVYGNIEDLKFKIYPFKSINIHKPVQRKSLENEELNMNKLIREALLKDMNAPSTVNE